jgi:hypothetical protein
MRTNLKNPKDDHKKGTLSDQPRLMCSTPTALLGSWVQQLIKDMASLGTEFETHAIWQGSVEEPTTKDFVAKKACTIAFSEAQGTHWSVIRCKEHLENCPDAVIGQATINLDSQVWESLEDSLPKLSLYQGDGYLIYQVFTCQKQLFTKKILKQFLFMYLRWVVPATPRMAKINGNRNLCAPKLIRTHSWLTPWCCPMSNPSSSH